MFIIPTDTCFGIGCFVNDLESYKKLYQLKGRDFSKPCAIFVDDLEYFKKNTLLTSEQIEYLKNYSKPYTILVDLHKVRDNTLLNYIKQLPNYLQYKKIGFRVANNDIQKKLLKQNLFFLTSANISGNKETKSFKKVMNYFPSVEILEKGDIKTKYYFSDVFEFVDDSIDKKYYRKNND